MTSLYKKGLAYHKDSWVNWDPRVSQTVLANQQVLADGTSERGGAVVVKKKLTQWYFELTDYADRLLDDLNQLEGTGPSGPGVQQNWIGRSIGADVDFAIEAAAEARQGVRVFTTRPDTLFGATSWSSPPTRRSPTNGHRRDAGALAAYREQVQALTEIERQSTEREKTGVFTERYAINPPGGEGCRSRPPTTSWPTTAPGHHGRPGRRQRDLDFARSFDLPVRAVVDTGE